MGKKRRAEYHLRKGGNRGKEKEIKVQIGVVYMTKNRGPRTDPWKTPQEELWKDERLSSHLTRKERDDKKDLNQLRTEP